MSSTEVPTQAPAAEQATHGWSAAETLDYGKLQEQQDDGSGWASNAAVYTFEGDEGEVGAANPEIEAQLFRKAGVGDGMSALELTVSVEGPNKIEPCKTFDSAGLHPVVLANVKLCGYDSPTAVQGYCIPAILQDKDVVAVAQTGSGKTGAYLIPIMSKLMGKVDQIGGPRVDTTKPDYDPMIHKVVATPLVLIICPTRELAQQIFNETRRLSYRSKLRPVCVYGGVPIKYNIASLQKGADILIGTAGRLRDLKTKLHVLNLERLRFTVIDEGDLMLCQDWEEELGAIIDEGGHGDHKFAMFSATFPKEARKLAREYLPSDYVRIRVGRAGSTHRNVKQDIVFVAHDQKSQALYDLLCTLPPQLTMVFCNSLRTVDRVDDFLYSRGLPTTFIHRERTQYEREDAMRAFTSGKSPILVTTGVSARGIDVSNVSHVVNYELPSTQYGGITEYVHRIGRTGRIGHKGHATSFYSDEIDSDIAPALVKILMETEQEIPDFLTEFKPEGAVEFDDDTDEEEVETENGGAEFGATAGPEGDGDVPAWGAAADGDEVAGSAWGPAAVAAPTVGAW